MELLRKLVSALAGVASPAASVLRRFLTPGTLIPSSAALAFLLMLIKNWLTAGEFTGLAFAPVAHAVITGDDLLVGRGVVALLLALDFAVLVLAWAALWHFAGRAVRALDRFDPAQP